MAHFALLDENNVVQAVFYGRDEDNENDLSLRTGQTYKRTSYNTKANQYYEWRDGIYQLALDQSKAFRKNFAAIGSTYNAELDAFVLKQPYASWTLNEETGTWDAPSVPPTLTDEEFAASKKYVWDEDAYQADNTQGWVLSQFNPSTGVFEPV